MIEEYEKIIKESENQHALLLSAYMSAGVGSEGDYKNKISEIERKISFLREQIKKHEGSVVPEEYEMTVYVCSALENQIKECLDSDLAKDYPLERNGKENIDEWVPYMGNSESINQLLKEFNDRFGFNFDIVLIDKSFETNSLVELDKKITAKKAIAIIDLLAVNQENRDIVILFDRHLANALMPICSRLSHRLIDYMEQKRKEVFRISSHLLSQCNGSCASFESPAEKDYFNKYLRNCFQTNITNSIQGINSNLTGTSTKIA